MHMQWSEYTDLCKYVQESLRLNEKLLSRVERDIYITISLPAGKPYYEIALYTCLASERL